MKLETLVAPQTSRHTSILGLMYGHQFDHNPDVRIPEGLLHEQLDHRNLVDHIVDFCDCV